MRSLIGAAALLAVLAAPSLAQDRFVAIKAKKVITGTGQEFSPGMLVIRNGKIEAVGKKVSLPPKCEVIEAPDQVLMPGLVLARSRYSLPSRRRSGNNSHLDVRKELFPRDGDMEELLKAGIVAVALIPDGNGVPGRAIVLRPTDGEVEERILAGAGYLRITMDQLPTDKVTLLGAFKEAEGWIERIKKAREAWEKKRKSAAAAAAAKKAAEAAKKKAKEQQKKGGDTPPKPKPAPKPQPKPQPQPKPKPKRSSRAQAAEALGHDHDDPHEGIEPALAGVDPESLDAAPTPKRPSAPAPQASKTFTPPKSPERAEVFMTFVEKPKQGPRVVLELGKASDYLHYLDGFGERKLEPFLYLENRGSESDLFHVVGQIGESGATVLLHPRVTNEPYTLTRRNLPLELSRAGCPVAFVPTRSLQSWREEVSLLIRAGFDREEAIAAMTKRPAQLLGLGTELGTLEKGRLADVILLDDDPFAPGATVQRVFLGGEPVWSAEEETE